MWVDRAGMFYQIEIPVVSAFFDFQPIIPTFVKEAMSSARQPRSREIEQQWQGSKRPGGYDLRLLDKTIDIFNAPRMNTSRKAKFSHHSLQEAGFLAIAFNQIDRAATLA